VTCDVGSETAVERAFAETLDVFGRVDACFANAAVINGAPFDQLSFAQWRSVLEVNLDGVFLTLRCAATHMKQRAERGEGGGRLVATSSLGALKGMPGYEAYAASKGAIISMMRALAIEFARYGVTANSIMPGHIETPMTARAYSNEMFRNALIPRIPAGRFGAPTDFAGIAVYLMSDASAYHTADTMLIDGGFTTF
jgi:NAD(P)-dependent dehydrogenase (short-subunit alcohol dehydrogenase family)